MNEDGRPWMICVRSDEVLEGAAITGSSQVMCERCAELVMVSPSGMAFVAAHDARVVCSACGEGEVTPNVVLAAVPGAMAEMAADPGVDFDKVRWIMRVLNIKENG